jgi:hypothetical protein
MWPVMGGLNQESWRHSYVALMGQIFTTLGNVADHAGTSPPMTVMLYICLICGEILQARHGIAFR